MPDTTHPERDEPPPPPIYFLDVVQPLAVSEAAARQALVRHGGVRGGDRSTVVAEAVAAMKAGVAQLCDSRRAVQLPITPEESVARALLRRYADVQDDRSDTGLMAEALGALTTVLRALLTPTGRAPAPSVLRDEPWPDGVIARYVTVAGAPLDIRFRYGGLFASCGGERCQWTAGQPIDLEPGGDDACDGEIDITLPEIQAVAQAHAETCRLLRRPVASA